jgi:hypothetical protein
VPPFTIQNWLTSMTGYPLGLHQGDKPMAKRNVSRYLIGAAWGQPWRYLSTAVLLLTWEPDPKPATSLFTRQPTRPGWFRQNEH